MNTILLFGQSRKGCKALWPPGWTLALFAVALAGLVASGCGDSASSGTGKSGKQKYHCPMHPTYVSDRLGDCPICNMKLVLIKADSPAKPMAAAADDETAHIKEGQFYCPMHPNIVSNEFGICPDCNMKLKKKEAETAASEKQVADSAAAPPGRISISIAPEKRQLIGLTLAEVEKRELSRKVRASALVEHDETDYARISPRFAGWVRKLHVNFTGAPVEQGEPLFTAYSPELFAAENEYLVAWKALGVPKDGASGSLKDSSMALVEAARLRLSLFEIGEEEIRALEQRGKASPEMLFRAPFSGHVLAKNAVEGKAFMAGESLFEVAKLHRVWVRAFVFEFELPLISVGQKAFIQFPYLRNTSVEAEVSFIYPHIDPQTRRGEIRIELDNPGHMMRPGMWANAEIAVESGDRLAVAASAIIDTGERYVAFVDGTNHHLEPREVKVGMKTDDYYEVLSGLKEGEKVVSRALFLVDSESQLKAAIAGMVSPGGHEH